MDEHGMQWFVRREGQLRGPFETLRFQRYVLLGRIRVGDEISRDGKRWEPFDEAHPMYPALLRDAVDEEGLKRLLAVREHLDERRGERRRIVPGGMHANPGGERRKGDRRQGGDPFLDALRARVRAREKASRVRDSFWRRLAAWWPLAVAIASIAYVATPS